MKQSKKEIRSKVRALFKDLLGPDLSQQDFDKRLKEELEASGTSIIELSNKIHRKQKTYSVEYQLKVISQIYDRVK